MGDGVTPRELALQGGAEPTEAFTAEVVRAEDGRQHALVARFRLVVVAGPDSGATHASAGDRVVIGTHDSADFLLRDPTVSRFHCEIRIIAGRPILRDLGSVNGVLCEGLRLSEAELRSGVVLTLGSTKIEFTVGSEQTKVSLSEHSSFGRLVGRSIAMRSAFALLERASQSDATVLLEGETGTGKEAAAESIHGAGKRAERPFIVVDCGAIPPDLLESELFGHEKGAFTGAVGAREGAFEAANGATIFLDEIGELGSDLQPKLLRALERREIKRVGGNRYLPVDVRVIAATNRNLRTEVNAGRFRPDLYYRLAVVEIRLPSLRERSDDLPELVQQMLRNLGVEGTDEGRALSSDSLLAQLSRHSWPGNVRELRNYIERCLVLHEPAPLGNSELSEPSTLPAPDLTKPLKASREQWSRVFERRYVEGMLRRHDGNVTAAARAAEVSRIYFYKLLWRHGLR